MTEGPEVRIKVDRSRCQGHTVCVNVAPEVFDLDDEGRAVTRVDTVSAGMVRLAARAATRCPEKAISVVDVAAAS